QKSTGGCGPGNSCQFSIEWNSGTQLCAAVMINSSTEVDSCRSSTGLVDGQWHYAALTVSTGNVLQLYVDGVPTGAPAMTMGAPSTTSSFPMNLGSESSGGEPFIGDLDEARLATSALSAAAIKGYYNTRRAHLQLLDDTGTGSGQGVAIGADCATGTRCADNAYAGVASIMRLGARYYSRTRLHTKTNDFWSLWSNDWLEVDSTTSLSVTVGSTVNLGSPTLGQDTFGSSLIQVTTNDTGGYQLLARDTSNTVGMTGTPSGTILDAQTPGFAPAVWAGLSPQGIGFSVRDATGGRLAKWGATGPFPVTDVNNNLYVGLGVADTLLHQRTTYGVAPDTVNLTTRLNVPTTQVAAYYSATVQLTALANP
ncbi:MAG: LamG domain-containing protein, partial [Salinibacterium sp.]|nr:LamG domain-containing protein [Salinibacterium sp.]